MFYGVAADADITKNRVHRFCEHMTFSQRSLKLLHGSLVVNEGNWGESPPPIRLMQGYGSVVDSTTPLIVGKRTIRPEGSPACVHGLLVFH